jgi:hypothetical protein
LSRKDQEDEARTLRAVACLWELLREARNRDLVRYRELGGLDAEEFLHAVDTGGQHPLLRKWEKDKAQNRFPPSLHEVNGRRLAMLLRLALERDGVGKSEARKMVAAALQQMGPQIGLAAASTARPRGLDEKRAPSVRRIEHWEENLRPPLGPQDEAVIKAALERCGGNRKLLVRRFLGLVEFLRKPLPLEARWR